MQEGQHLCMPVAGVVGYIRRREPHRGGDLRERLVTRNDLLGEAKAARAVVPGLFLHPLIVKADNVRVRPVVDGQRDALAQTLGEQRRELQDVADGRASEAVQSLVVVADHTQVTPLIGQQHKDAFLDGVGVLVLVDHQVRELFAQLRQHLGPLFQKLKRLVLDTREVETVVLVHQLLILTEASRECPRFDVRGCF